MDLPLLAQDLILNHLNCIDLVTLSAVNKELHNSCTQYLSVHIYHVFFASVIEICSGLLKILLQNGQTVKYFDISFLFHNRLHIYMQYNPSICRDVILNVHFTNKCFINFKVKCVADLVSAFGMPCMEALIPFITCHKDNIVIIDYRMTPSYNMFKFVNNCSDLPICLFPMNRRISNSW